MDPRVEEQLLLNRRHFFSRSASGLGIAALATLLGERGLAGESGSSAAGGLPDLPHFAPKAKRVIYLFQSGAPSQMDLFDYKPQARRELQGTELPDSIRHGPAAHRHDLAGRRAFRSRPRSIRFAQHGQAGAWLSELLPHTADVADELCFVKTMHTEAINHDPAITFFQTGAQLAGRPSIGAWLSLRPGQREPRPAGLRGHDLAGQRQPDRSAALRPAVGQRLSADEVSGRQVPLRRRPGA